MATQAARGVKRCVFNVRSLVILKNGRLVRKWPSLEFPDRQLSPRAQGRSRFRSRHPTPGDRNTCRCGRSRSGPDSRRLLAHATQPGPSIFRKAEAKVARKRTLFRTLLGEYGPAFVVPPSPVNLQVLRREALLPETAGTHQCDRRRICRLDVRLQSMKLQCSEGVPEH